MTSPFRWLILGLIGAILSRLHECSACFGQDIAFQKKRRSRRTHPESIERWIHPNVFRANVPLISPRKGPLYKQGMCGAAALHESVGEGTFAIVWPVPLDLAGLRSHSASVCVITQPRHRSRSRGVTSCLDIVLFFKI